MKLFRFPHFLWGILLLCSWMLLLAGSLQAQEEPHYNRFQYHKYRWQTLHTEAFHIYFPKNYDSLASFASVQLPDLVQELKSSTGFSLTTVPNIIIYPSPDQYSESNIGMYATGRQTFPTINLQGDRMVLAFDGSYERFRMQLKIAWMRMCWASRLADDLTAQLGAQSPPVPDWYREGAIQYFATGWSLEQESLVLERFLDTATITWDRFREKNPALAGQAFCYFLAQRYHREANKQILFQLRQRKSLARAIRLATKRTLDTLTAQCVAYYRERAQWTQQYGPQGTKPDKWQQAIMARYPNRQLYSLQYSPDGRYAVFVLTQDNKRSVYCCPLKDTASSAPMPTRLLTYVLPPWQEQYSQDVYPLISWSEKSDLVYALYPEKGWVQLHTYRVTGDRVAQHKLYGVDGVHDAAPYGKDWLLSAYRLGKSDLVTYDPQRLRYKALTDDQADNTTFVLDPMAHPAMLYYRSGYPADSLYHPDTLVKSYGIYGRSVTGNSVGEEYLVQADSAWWQGLVPIAAKQGELVRSGYSNGYQAQDTIRPQQGRALHNPEADANAHPMSPWLSDYFRNKREGDSLKALLDKLKKEHISVLGSILSPGNTKEAAQQHKDSLRKALAYTPGKVKPYILQLFSAYFSAQVNNDYFINRYQPYQGYLGTFKFPEVGAMVQSGFSDLFENHRFHIGYRLPAGSEGSDFFVRYANTARKLDWHLMYFRKMGSLQPDADRDWKDQAGKPYPFAAKVKTHYYELGFHYPLAYEWSLDFTTAARNDQTIFLATDRYSLNYDNLKSWWSINTLSLSVDKRHKRIIPMLYKGWEAKLIADGMVSTGKNSTLLYGARLNVAWHQPLVKNITLVTRLQAGYSGGASRILYNFGGMDNNVAPRVDTSVRFGQDAPYAFQTLVTPFRGYAQNSIYGSSFVLANVDVYVPLFRDLIPLRTGFSMLQNLQLGVFADAAATKVGRPTTSNASLYGYGISARTIMAGYPIRFDLAWPGDFSAKPMWHLSFALR